jgi:hypothetical protein
MIGWIVSLIVGLAGFAFSWYYRSKSTQAADLSGLVLANNQVLSDLNTLLATLTAKANQAGAKDQENANQVKTPTDAAAFLNGSVPATSTSGVNPAAGVFATHNS